MAEAPEARLVDTHCHLTVGYDGGVAGVLERAEAAGVARIVAIADTLESSEATLSIAKNWPGSVRATVGIHPHEAKTLTPEALHRLAHLARAPQVVAYGEIGLDYHYDFSPRDVQRRAFECQLQQARDLGLPVVIHSREASEDTLAILRDVGLPASGGVVHCFTYGLEVMESLLELGLYVGVTGVVTFNRAEEIRAVAAALPSDRILIETDAPYLAPVPYRGRRNEPAYLPYVAAKCAEVRGVDIATLVADNERNAERLFGKWVSF